MGWPPAQFLGANSWGWDLGKGREEPEPVLWRRKQGGFREDFVQS